MSIVSNISPLHLLRSYHLTLIRGTLSVFGGIGILAWQELHIRVHATWVSMDPYDCIHHR